VTQDYSTLPGGTATVMAHEIGHNFGFEHDDEIGSCECDDQNGVCIMNSFARLAPSYFPINTSIKFSVGLTMDMLYLLRMILFTPHYILISLLTVIFICHVHY